MWKAGVIENRAGQFLQIEEVWLIFSSPVSGCAAYSSDPDWRTGLSDLFIYQCKVQAKETCFFWSLSGDLHYFSILNCAGYRPLFWKSASAGEQ
jgi:hypothetical protein